MQSILEEILQSGQDRGEITKEKTAAELVELLFLIARGVVFDWGLNDGKYNLSQKMDELFSMQSRLLLPT